MGKWSFPFSRRFSRLDKCHGEPSTGRLSREYMEHQERNYAIPSPLLPYICREHIQKSWASADRIEVRLIFETPREAHPVPELRR